MSIEEALKLMEQSRFAGIGLPGMVKEAWRTSLLDLQEEQQDGAFGEKTEYQEGDRPYV